MPRKNHNAGPRPEEIRPNQIILPPKNDGIYVGYQPTGPRLDVTNPPQGGSGLKTTPEAIVREFRIMDRGIRIESVKEPVSKIERAIQIFLIFTFGWGFGYLHHFLTGR